MDFLKGSLPLYEVISLLLVGFLAICAVWIRAVDWKEFIHTMNSLSASKITLLFFVSFAAGGLVQEGAYNSIGRLVHPGRDYWESKASLSAHNKLRQELGEDVNDYRVAFDYCLTRIEGHFAARDVFVATSDLARGLVIVAIISFAPLFRIARDVKRQNGNHRAVLVVGVVTLVLVGSLSWSRMARFRGYADEGVFHACLATAPRAATR